MQAESEVMYISSQSILPLNSHTMNNNSAVEVNVHHEYVALCSPPSTPTSQIPRVWFLLRAPSKSYQGMQPCTSHTVQSCITEQGKAFRFSRRTAFGAIWYLLYPFRIYIGLFCVFASLSGFPAWYRHIIQND